MATIHTHTHKYTLTHQMPSESSSHSAPNLQLEHLEYVLGSRPELSRSTHKQTHMVHIKSNIALKIAYHCCLGVLKVTKKLLCLTDLYVDWCKWSNIRKKVGRNMAVEHTCISWCRFSIWGKKGQTCKMSCLIKDFRNIENTQLLIKIANNNYVGITWTTNIFMGLCVGSVQWHWTSQTWV